MSDEATEQIKQLCVKMDDLYNMFSAQAEQKIKEQPLAYTIGAFVGGIMFGYFMNYMMQRK